MKPERSESVGSEGPVEDLRIVLIGRSGAGKSSVGNAILGGDVFGERGTRASEIQRGTVEDRIISIIDTPGFFSSHLTDEELREQMRKSLDLSDPGPHVFLLVINLENFTEDVGRTVRKIHELFGNEVFRFTMVLFTRRVVMSKREWIEFRLNRKTRELLSFFEEKCHTFVHNNKRDRKQISSLLENIDHLVRKNGREHYVNERNQKNVEEEPENDETNRPEEPIREEPTENNKEAESGKQSSDGNQSKDLGETCQIRDEKEDAAENHPVADPPDLRIVLLGRGGSGKSWTANTILGGNASKTSSSNHQTAVVCGRNISVMDSPGPLDPSMTREQLKAQIETSVEMIPPGPHVFLLVIRLEERFTDEEKNMVRWILENFREDVVRYTIVLFTHADLLKSKALDEILRDTPDLQVLLERFGGRFHSFNNKDMENRQVTELLEKIEKMMENNGGKHYTNEVFAECQNNAVENTWTWLRRVFILIIGALAATAVAKTRLEG